MAPPEHRSPDPTSAVRRMTVIVTATVLGGLIAAVAVVGSDSLEPRLTGDARLALDDAGFTSVAVRFDGREAFLSGATATPARLAEAAEVVERVEGVRWATVADDPANVQPVPTITPTPLTDPDEVARTWLTETDVLFEADSAVLSDTALIQLSQVVAILNDYPALRLTVAGHIAITTGTTAEAIAFSAQRAQAVVDELIRRGVAPVRLTAVGVGDAEAAADNSTVAGAAQNRRATFSIQEDS